MDKNEIIELAREMSERLPILKTQEDLKDFSEILTKFTVERALNAELEHHLESEEAHNTRNGYSSKTIHTEDGAIELTTPRDRKATFEPALIKKGQRRFTSMDDKILALYARGMTTRDIVDVACPPKVIPTSKLVKMCYTNFEERLYLCLKNNTQLNKSL